MIEEIEKAIFEGNLSERDQVQIIALIGKYLGLKTLPEYAKQNNLSYNGVKKCRKTIELFGVKLVIDNI